MNTFLLKVLLVLLFDSSIFVFADSDDACPRIVSRRQWGGKSARHIFYQVLPIRYVIIHHTVTPRCSSKLSCSRILTSIQSHHMDALDFDDIGFNFLVGDDAIYEGAGWHVRGAHTFGYNTNGTGIAFIGDFTEQLPTPNAIENVKKLLACGVQRGELDSNYNLLAARQVTATESPGLELYSEIQEWRNWHSQP